MTLGYNIGTSLEPARPTHTNPAFWAGMPYLLYSVSHDEEEAESCLFSDAFDERESESSSDDEDANSDQDTVRLSNTLLMYPKKKLSKHRNVVAGEMCNNLECENRSCVIKFDPNQIVRELNALLKLGCHSNVISLFDSGTFNDEMLDISYIVLERCHDLNLEDYLLCDDIVPVYDANRGLGFCKQIINGMKFVHENLIIHKDLKPSNIFLTHDLENVKIGDFGSSQAVTSPSSMVLSSNIFGTLGYRPPESLEPSHVSLKSDIFSLGVVFHFLLSNGKSPFGSLSDKWDHNTKIGVIDLSQLIVSNPMATQHLIKSMLNLERRRRPLLEEVERHPCWSGDENVYLFEYKFEEEVLDCERSVVDEAPSEEKPDDSRVEFLRVMSRLEAIHGPFNTGTGTLELMSTDAFDERESESSGDDEDANSDQDWVKISQKIIMDRKRPLCKHAEVYYAEQDMGRTSRKLAVKLLKKTKRSEEEAELLVQLENHPNIVKIIECGLCSESLIPHVYIAMELCHQNLDQYVKSHRFDLIKASTFFKQTVSAIDFIHDNNIAHGDLKPSNILVTRDENSVKVSDFGVSKSIPDNQSRVTSTYFGTQGFKAPESYGAGRLISYKADIYPLGINGYFIFTHGLHPFGPYSFNWVHNIVHNKNRDLSLIPLFPEPTSFKRLKLIRLFKRMLECDPKDRPTAQEVKADSFFDSSQGGEDEGTSFNTREATKKAIKEVLQNGQKTMPADAIDKLCTSLISAKEKLKEGRHDEGMRIIRGSTPDSLSADDMNNIGKKLEDELPVFSVLLHRVAAQIFNPNTTSPDEAVAWISERVTDIRCATEQIMDSESDGNSRNIAINICPKFMQELLQDLRAVEHVKSDIKTLGEVSCIISMTRININAGKYPDVAPNGDVIRMCHNGIALLGIEFGTNMNKYKYYGYLLNNIGEAHMQLHQFEEAQRHFEKAVAVKKEATYRSREAKHSDINMTNNNLRECTLQKNDHPN